METKPRFENYRFEIRPIPADEGGGFFVSIPDLPGCVSDGESYEDAIASAREAFDAWMSSYEQSGRAIPVPGAIAKPAKILLRLARSTHQELSAAALADGVSLNTFISILITEAQAFRAGRNSAVKELVKSSYARTSLVWSTPSSGEWTDLLENSAQETILTAVANELATDDSYSETRAGNFAGALLSTYGRSRSRRSTAPKRKVLAS